MRLLRFCSKLLARHFPEPKLNDELKEILAEIEQLYTQVLESDLPADLKTLLLDLIHALRTAAHEYRVRGPERLSEGIESVLGKLALNRGAAERLDQTEEGNRFSRTFWKTVALLKYAPDVRAVIETVAPAVKFLIGSVPSSDDVPPPPID